MKNLTILTLLLPGIALAGQNQVLTPEPGTILMVAGAGALAFVFRKRIRNKK